MKNCPKNYDGLVKINHNKTLPYIPDHSYNCSNPNHWWLRIRQN